MAQRKTKAEKKGAPVEIPEAHEKPVVSAGIGNQFWRARSSHGRKPIFPDPEALWQACVEYFEWVEKNPLNEEKLFSYQGIISRGTVYRMRAMTIAGLCLFLDICEKTWANYRDKEDFLQVVTRAEKIIYEQKFTGAAADLLNPNIIARDLGLAEKSEHGGIGGGPLVVQVVKFGE